MTDTVPCKGCGADMIWAETPDGKRIPLDAKAPVYFVTADGVATRAVGYYVSHFKTCPRASDFSASKRGRPAAPEPEKDRPLGVQPERGTPTSDPTGAGRPDSTEGGTS